MEYQSEEGFFITLLSVLEWDVLGNVFYARRGTGMMSANRQYKVLLARKDSSSILIYLTIYLPAVATSIGSINILTYCSPSLDLILLSEWHQE